MQLQTFASKANLSVPTALLDVNDVDYSVVNYAKFAGEMIDRLTDVIDPSKPWEPGCTLTPGSNEGYFVAVSIFQKSRHFPVVTIRVHGNIHDAAMVYEICAACIENSTWH